MKFLRLLGTWPVALVCVVVLAAAVLLPGLGDFGLWEPQERQLADRVAPRTDLVKPEPAAQTSFATPNLVKPLDQTGKPDKCEYQAPKDATARTLTQKAMVWGRDHLADSDAGRRLPLALLGLLTALATAGIAMRIAGPRAGVLAGLVLLSMPLFVFQSRQLTSEIGTAAGASLTIYGLVAFAGRFSVIGIVETVVALLSLAGGLALGFASGGALLGVIVPLGAYAAAAGLGAPLVRTGVREVLRIARPAWADRVSAADDPLATQIKGAVALIAVIVVAREVVHQIYSLREAMPRGIMPPPRELFGRELQTTGCWSTALGGIWRDADDLRYIFDSTFEQIAYGTFPWGILAPVAMVSLLASARREHRVLGGLALAWAGTAWIASEAFQRKVGFTLWAGFPALALAVGVWFDGVLAARANRDGEGLPRTALLIGVFAALGAIVIGKDLQSFTDKLTSLLVGGSDITYPTVSRTLFLATRLWVLILGAYIAIGFAISMATWREAPDVELLPKRHRALRVLMWIAMVAFYPIALPIWLVDRWQDDRAVKLRFAAKIGALAAIAGTAVLGAFWAFVWQPKIAQHVSSRAMFDTYLSLRKPGDQLVIMGDLGDAPHDYAPDATPEIVPSRDKIVEAIGRANRVFAITPQTELCQLHREIGGKKYYVIDDRNLKSLLLSNRLDGTTDKNPLARAIVHEEPKNIPNRVDDKRPIIFDSRIQLIGWDIPKSVSRGSKFRATLYYKILQPVGSTWTVIMHFDGQNGRAGNGDHKPINDRCPTSTWQPGDYIIDTFTVPGIGGAYPAGEYGVFTGFFTGSAPNFKNMTVSTAPPAMLDEKTDRVKITTIILD